MVLIHARLGSVSALVNDCALPFLFLLDLGGWRSNRERHLVDGAVEFVVAFFVT